MRWLYPILASLAFPFVWPVLWLRRKTRPGQAERLGVRGPFRSAGPGPHLWLHGASAGDVWALAPLAQSLKSRLPHCRLTLSAITDSGLAMARARVPQADELTFAPYDLPWTAGPAMQRARPDLLVLEAAELWPSWIRAAQREGAKVALTNGRFSPGRLFGYRLLFATAGNLLESLDLLLMRDAAEADRAVRLGAPRERVHVTGNTKIDALSLSNGLSSQALGLRPSPRLWVAGSTHLGEEAILLDVHRRLLHRHPGLRLILAPRYTERAASVLELARRQGLTAGLRSDTPRGDESWSVLLLDTIGELSEAYALGAFAFVGGTFSRRGGQNLLEPAARGVPVVYGPRVESVRDFAELINGRGGFQVATGEELFQVAHELLSHPARREEAGRSARAAVAAARGAAERNAELLVTLLSNRPPRASRDGGGW